MFRKFGVEGDVSAKDLLNARPNLTESAPATAGNSTDDAESPHNLVPVETIGCGYPLVEIVHNDKFNTNRSVEAKGLLDEPAWDQDKLL
jgi:hypothetical protein